MPERFRGNPDIFKPKKRTLENLGRLGLALTLMFGKIPDAKAQEQAEYRLVEESDRRDVDEKQYGHDNEAVPPTSALLQVEREDGSPEMRNTWERIYTGWPSIPDGRRFVSARIERDVYDPEQSIGPERSSSRSEGSFTPDDFIGRWVHVDAETIGQLVTARGGDAVARGGEMQSVLVTLGADETGSIDTTNLIRITGEGDNTAEAMQNAISRIVATENLAPNDEDRGAGELVHSDDDNGANGVDITYSNFHWERGTEFLVVSVSDATEQDDTTALTTYNFQLHIPQAEYGMLSEEVREQVEHEMVDDAPEAPVEAEPIEYNLL